MSLNSFQKRQQVSKDQRRALVSSILLRNPGSALTQKEICKRLGEKFVNPDTGNPYSVGTINGDIQYLQELWREKAQEEISEWKAKQIEQINEVINEAWKSNDLDAILKAIKMQSDIIGTAAPKRVDQKSDDRMEIIVTYADQRDDSESA